MWPASEEQMQNVLIKMKRQRTILYLDVRFGNLTIKTSLKSV